MLAAALVAAVATAAVVGLQARDDVVAAEPLDPALRGSDRALLADVLGGRPSSGDALIDGDPVLEVVRRADLPQLAVWRERRAGASLLRGQGPDVRRYGDGTPGDVPPRPLSIVVRCDEDAAYDWSIRGRAPGDDAIRVLAAARADRCGAPSVATFELPAGAGVSGFDLRVPEDVGWSMALVYPLD